MKELRAYGLNPDEVAAYAGMVERKEWVIEDSREGQSITYSENGVLGVPLALNFGDESALGTGAVVVGLEARMFDLLEELKGSIE